MRNKEGHSIKGLRAAGDVDGLIAALGDVCDAQRRLAARLALIDLGRPALPRLVAALRSSEAYVRRGAASVLGGIGDERAVGPLVDVLEDEDPYVGWYAAFALGDLGGPAAVRPLLMAALNGCPSVSRAAGISLQRIATRHGVSSPIDLTDDLESDLREMAESVLARAPERLSRRPALRSLAGPGRIAGAPAA